MTGRASWAVQLIAVAVAAIAAVPAMADDGDDGGARGRSVPAVYTLTNSSAGNAVLAFGRAGDGSLSFRGSTPSGGTGSGGGLGSQGAVILDNDAERLFAVNAGSDSVSSFVIDQRGLRLVDTAPSGGDLPISVTYKRGILYVLNAGTPNTISALVVRRDGRLTPLTGSTRPLSAASTNPAQVEFTPDGRALVVSEKGTNLLTSYAVDRHGVAGEPVSYDSTGATPFGFAFTNRGDLIVSNAASTGASSYAVGRGGEISPVSVVATGQGAACWTVVTQNGKVAYTANTGAGNISSYAIARDGSLSLLAAVAGTTGGTPADAAISGNGRYLYVRNGSQGALNAFRIAADGTLTPLAGTSGLPAGFAGLAAS